MIERAQAGAAGGDPVGAEPSGPSRRGGARVRGVVRPAAAGLALVPWLWFPLRGVHPALDLVAIVLPLLVTALVAALVVAAVLLRRTVLVVPTASALAFGVVAVILPWSPASGGRPIRSVTVLTANIAGPEQLTAARSATASLLAAPADVVVVDELSPLVDRLLAPSFPYSAKTFPDGEENPLPPAVGVFARVPIVEARPAPDGLPGLRLRLEGPAGPFVLYALHVPKAAVGGSDWSTSFAGHDRLITTLAADASAESLPVVVAGDLNTPDRSQGYRTLRDRFRDAARTSWTGPTSVKSSLLWRFLALRIDHVFVTADWCAAHAGRVALAGSDHRGVRVDVGPCDTT
jgi:endonuclease/exonuclease/phosphatase (EEP) superfamily protein YafD